MKQTLLAAAFAATTLGTTVPGNAQACVQANGDLMCPTTIDTFSGVPRELPEQTACSINAVLYGTRACELHIIPQKGIMYEEIGELGNHSQYNFSCTVPQIQALLDEISYHGNKLAKVQVKSVSQLGDGGCEYTLTSF